MQTFLPYADYQKTASVLDRARLGKQRIEAWQILLLLTRDSRGIRSPWRRHPAVNMWGGAEAELVLYSYAICDEWVDRGYRDKMRDRIQAVAASAELGTLQPAWRGLRGFHIAMRSNLLRKNPQHYRQYWPLLRDDLPYVWP